KTPAAKAPPKPVEQTPVAETGIDNWSLEEQHRKSTEEDQDSEEEMEKDKEQEKQGGQGQGGTVRILEEGRKKGGDGQGARMEGFGYREWSKQQSTPRSARDQQKSK